MATFALRKFVFHLNIYDSRIEISTLITTFLLLEFADLLLHPITKIINLFLSSHVFRDEMKLALVTPVQKKSDLVQSLILVHVYWTVMWSSLRFTLGLRTLWYLSSQHTIRITQLRRYLIRLSILLLSVDGKNAALLALLDQSASFDTIH